MWYEILPSIGVIFTAMSLGGLGTALAPYLILNKATMRRLHDNYEQGQYLRDQRLTGSAYVMQGLDAIPDDDASSGCSTGKGKSK